MLRHFGHTKKFMKLEGRRNPATTPFHGGFTRELTYVTPLIWVIHNLNYGKTMTLWIV